MGSSNSACEHSTTRWQDVIANPDVQIVNIASPNYLHAEVAAAALAAGKHIFCEKPVGRTPAETALVESLARKAGVLNWVGFNYRWSPMVQYAQQLISDGKLGKLTHVRGRFLAGYASSPDTVLSWRFQRELSGSGVCGDLLSHVIDMSLFLAGPIRQVVASQETFIRRRPLEGQVAGKTPVQLGDVTNEDYVGVLVEFANGARGTFEACRVIQGHKCGWAIELEGTQGGVSWDFERMNELEVFCPDGASVHDGFSRIVSGPHHPNHGRFNPATGTGLGYDDLKTIEVHQFLKSIAEGRQAEPGLVDALRVAEVLAAVERSWQTGAWQPVTNLSAKG